jgi:CO dehydrogenase maturation factor
VRSLLGELATGGTNEEVTVMDMEASIEHMSRATIRHVDAMLMVAEPYFRSLETVGRIAPLARELDIGHIWAVANKVRSPRDEEIIRAYCADREIEVGGVVPFDEAVQEADRESRALIDHESTAPAVVAIEWVADLLEKQVGDLGGNGRGDQL